MSDQDPKRPGIATVPPPPGEEDLYSASTVVGQASAELLALVRAAEEGNADAKSAEKITRDQRKSDDDAKLASMKEAASRAAKQAAANEVAREAVKAASAAPPPPTTTSSGPPSTRKAAPLETASAPPRPGELPRIGPGGVARPAEHDVPLLTALPRSSALQDTTRRAPVKTGDEPRPAAGGLPPAVAILLVFAAAVLALFALVR